MTRRLIRLSLYLTFLVCAGCQAPLSIPAGRSAIRVRFDAVAKKGYREPSSAAYSSDYAPANVGAFERVDYRALHDLVVWVEPADDQQRPAPPEVVIEAGHAARVPTLLAVASAGSRLRIRVGDVRETIYSVSPGNEFHLGSLEPHSEVEWRVAQEGVIEIWSARWLDPIATVYVAPTPWVRVADGDETVTFNDLPPGRCRVSCWHARLPGGTSTVELLADRASSVRLTVGVNSLPKIP